mmetsp:Transcript_8374/g.21562  ORF Transcript_8374/g.21562 Transcript_8374/m.21562 type:complete len:212 (+) Transcript_8374:3-638(+)
MSYLPPRSLAARRACELVAARHVRQVRVPVSQLLGRDPPAAAVVDVDPDLAERVRHGNFQPLDVFRRLVVSQAALPKLQIVLPVQPLARTRTVSQTQESDAWEVNIVLGTLLNCGQVGLDERLGDPINDRPPEIGQQAAPLRIPCHLCRYVVYEPLHVQHAPCTRARVVRVHVIHCTFPDELFERPGRPRGLTAGSTFAEGHWRAKGDALH